MDLDNNNINEEGISISELWEIFKARFTWFITTLILVVVAAIIYLQYVIPQYSSTVTVLVEPITTSSSLDDLMLSNLSSSSSKISTEVELLKSRTNIDAALDLLDLSEYKDSVGIPYSEFYTIGPESDAISVSSVKDTKLVSISVTDENPRFAADFANALSVSYDNLLTKIAKNSKTSQREFLEQQIPINEEELKEASDKLSDYKEESGVLQLTEKSTMLVEQISYYELRKEPLNLQKIEANSKIESIYSNLLEENITLPSAKELTSDASFKKLIEAYSISEAELIMYEAVNASTVSDSSMLLGSRTSELNSTLSSISKQMLDNINQKLKKYSNSDILVSAMLNEYGRAVLTSEICDIGLDVLNKRSEQFNEELDQLPIIERKVVELQRDVTVLQQIGVQLRTMLEEVKLVEAAVTGNVTLVDKAIVPEKPVSPNKLLILAVSILLGAALGFLLALVVDMADNTIKTTEQVRKILKNTKIPLLGWIPLVKDKTLNPSGKKNIGYKNLSVYEDPIAFESEKYMAIVSNIIYSGEVGKNRSITVTSCDVSEGKSTLVANMALCLANMGSRVLLVDGDFRMPSIEAKFGYSRAKVGLVNLIQEHDVKLEDIVLQPIDDMPLLHLLPPGRLPLVPIAILTNPKMDYLNSLIGPYYDYILIDAPPLEYASEVMTFGERFDSLVINVRANVTTKPALKTLLQSLNRVESKISGVVLNACLPKDAETTANVSSKYGYGYGSKYGSKYFYGSEKTKNNRAITSRHKAIRVYKQSLRYRKIRDTDWQKNRSSAPIANIKSNLKNPEDFSSTVLKTSYKTTNEVNYDDILDFLENDPLASGKPDQKDTPSKDSANKENQKPKENKNNKKEDETKA
ncbi:MAG: polysaccharide biosynthesis tyrosine autokinase [Sphaerochaetaceae bacterium]|nr:polysaccharide biosynthesis tyrosine autokinase [Sphaerochaetaceae bacterium]MDC7237371.1 polysaccharide biosynthesis tyrosine autokinase [Sphaerochaetaceae bacterium]